MNTAVRQLFPVLQHCTYVNTAMSGLMYDPLLQWRHSFDERFNLEGSQILFDSGSILSETRNTIARFIGASDKEVSLVPNFTIGLNMMLEGLPKNQNVLLLNTDYPSVNWPVEDRGFKVVYANINEHLEENIYQRVETNHIDVLVLSLVQWVDGILIDLEFIKALKKEFPQLLIIADGTQFCGMYTFDFRASGIDVLGTSGYKWLLGGYGNGFFIVREDVQDRFDLKTIGSGSVEGNPQKRNDIPFHKYLEPGHLDALNFGSLNFSLNFLMELGLEKIHHQNKILSKHAKELFDEAGLLSQHTKVRKEQSTIFNCRGDTLLFKELLQKKVICAPRGEGIRLAFHFYNTLEEVGQIAKMLKN